MEPQGLDDMVFKQFSLKLNLSDPERGLNQEEIREDDHFRCQGHLKRKKKILASRSWITHQDDHASIH